MQWRRSIHALRARLRAIVFGRRVEQDIQDELSFHVAMQMRANLQGGMNEAEAHRSARQAMGGVEQAKEYCRDTRPLRWVQDLGQDLRYARRSLRRDPSFTVVAIVTLALGIGANTAMFSVLNTFLLRALPYPAPDRLVRVFRTSIHSQSWPHSVANFVDQREKNAVFSHMVAFTEIRQSLVEDGEAAEGLQAMGVTADFFPALGVSPALGRAFAAEEDRPGANKVVVLSDRFWQRRFGGDPNVVGRTLRLEGEPVEVIGVMPPAFENPLLWGPVDVWRPLAFTAEQLRNRGNNFLRAFAKLKPGVSLGQAQDAMASLAANISRATSSNQDESLRLEPLQVMGVDDVRRSVIWFTFGLAGFVLLIGCANLANLQLVRVAARTREHGIRAALGAARVRLLRQSLTESLVVAVLGGALGLVVAVGGVEFIGRRLFGDLPGASIALDVPVFGFALLCSTLTGLVFGTVPAWLASRADVNKALKNNQRGSTTAHHGLRQALVVAEVAFALILLTGAGLFLRGLQRFVDRDPGWHVDGLLTAQFGLRGPNYTTPAQRLVFYQRLEERLGALPGVAKVALSNSLPLWGFNSSGDMVVEGQPVPAPGHRPEAFAEPVSLRYFDTLGIHLRAGRVFTATDTADQPQVVIVNETMARRFWPNESPLGKRIVRGGGNQNWLSVVGVVNDVGFPANLSEPYTRLEAFRPLAQAAVPAVYVTIRTAAAPETLTGALRRAVAELDPTVPVVRIRTARSLVAQGLGNISLLGTLLGAFAALGLTLAAVGIYGVTSYSVAQRTGELGIRMALGAQARDVLWLVLARGAGLIVLGALLGSGGAYAVARLLIAAIPALPTRDPVTLAGLTLALVAVALLACYLPARRATKVDPLVALRQE